MNHFLVVIEAVLVSVLAGAAFFRGRRWWQYRVFVPAALALIICELAPLMLDVSTDTGEIAIAGLLMAQGTLMWFMLQDRIRNKLQVLAGSMQGSAEVFQAIEDVADAVDELSDAALKRWENRIRLANGR